MPWPAAYLIAGGFVWSVVIVLHRKHVLDGLLRAMIFSIPISFVSIFDTPYSDIPVSWFDVLSLALLLHVLSAVLMARTLFVNATAVAAVAFPLLTLPALLISGDYASSLKQFLHIVQFAFFLVAGTHLAATHRFRALRLSRVMSDYVMSVRLTALALLCQFSIAHWFDVVYGNVMRMGGGRVAWGFLFGDFSFLSLYLATGSAILLTQWITHVRREWPVYLLDLSIHIVALVLTTARTGIFALGLVAPLMAMRRAATGSGWRKRISSIILAGGLVAAVVYGLTVVRPQDVWADSGRYVNFSVGIRYFLASPLVGVGLGVAYVERLTGVSVPHNLLIQYLFQGGLLAAIPLTLIVIALLRQTYRAPIELQAAMLTSVAGGMVIPDLLNSRFFSILSLLVLMVGLKTTCNDSEAGVINAHHSSAA